MGGVLAKFEEPAKVWPVMLRDFWFRNLDILKISYMGFTVITWMHHDEKWVCLCSCYVLVLIFPCSAAAAVLWSGVLVKRVLTQWPGGWQTWRLTSLLQETGDCSKEIYEESLWSAAWLCWRCYEIRVLWFIILVNIYQYFFNIYMPTWLFTVLGLPACHGCTGPQGSKLAR